MAAPDPIPQGRTREELNVTLSDVLDKVNDIKEKVDEIKEVVDGL